MYLKKLSKLSSEEILEGLFGIEWESLRVNIDGELSLSPHPSIFGDKLTNSLITTDFSESQIEIITPTFDNLNETFKTFSVLYDIVNASIPDDEYLWMQSIPCTLPYDNEIPIAQYSEEGENSQIYRENLANKYGLKKQMISGVHFNFSFKHDLIKKLYEMHNLNLSLDDNKNNYSSLTNESNPSLSFKDFKNEIYLKIARNYLRYCWLIIYLTGCSVGSDKTFTDECISLMDEIDKYGNYYSTKGPSFRNASCGYKNLKKLYPSYENVSNFTQDIIKFIDNGDISEPKELYTQIRLKPKDPSDILKSLEDDGIEYIEIRTLDINPFYRMGVIKQEMDFLHLFLIYMLVKEESDYLDWQKEANINEECVAEKGYVESTKLLKDGEKVNLKDWAIEIIDEMYDMCETLDIKEFSTLNIMKNRILNSNLTPGKCLLSLIKKYGFINAHMILSIHNKQNSIHTLENLDSTEFNEHKKYIDLALTDC